MMTDAVGTYFPATQRMLDAIMAGDKPSFMKALQEGADVDANNGEPLLLTATYKRYDFAKELNERHANIHLSICAAQMEILQQDRKYHSTKSPQDAVHLDLKNKMVAVAARLDAYQKGFKDSADVRKIEALQNIADNIESFRATALEMFGPQDLKKSAPQVPGAKVGLQP